MSDSPFKVIGNRNNDGALNWIKFTIDIALNILSHRLISKINYTEEEFHINELITRELLGRNIWKFSEAYGKFRGCPFWSVKAFDHFVSMKKQNKTKAEYEKNLRHEHVYPQILLIKKLKDLKKPSFKTLEDLFKKYAIAAVITKDENDLLNKAKLRTLTISDENIWKRYNNKDVQIKIKNNSLNNDFFKYHKAKMEEAKVFDKI
jgi:hypothetical protein